MCCGRLRFRGKSECGCGRFCMGLGVVFVGARVYEVMGGCVR